MADFKSTLEDGVSKAQSGIESNKKKIETTMEIRKIENEIKRLSNEKVKYLYKIGQYIHLLYRKNDFIDPEIKSYFDEITRLDQSIWEQKETTKTLKVESGSLTCRKCNEKIQGDEKFCPNCGELVTPEQESDYEASCSVCGQALFENYNFCPACGIKC